MSSDPFDLERFLTAQEGVYEAALVELRGGRKRTHWMWFVFPQFFGLGASATSRRYAIRSLEEARAYLDHPELPDPDLIIRSANEQRLSNFLLWESAYAELYFSPKPWPDWDGEDLKVALAEYKRRSRTFGVAS